ncbi:unnamed protein product [Paramecium pentaurelia]|uniref:Uncharacterized protein n=1 Tax=Paramecium pentaurelia TaxID=43138 RepID=A0A8S1V5P0_9CILI|nr:unnamed protein product [Paramecium pentaurelia]
MDVYSILNDVADCGNVTQQHIHNMHVSFLGDTQQFTKQLECCYLKIIKNFNGTSKQHRKLFENVTEKFVTFMIKKWNESTLPAQKTRKQISTDNTRSFLLYLMQLFAEGLDSQNFATRICCGRHLFMILRCIPPQLLNQLVDEKTAYDMLNHTVGLFKNTKLQKTGKTQKGLAVKLGSYLQHIAFEERKQNKLKQAIVALKYEMVRTICEDDKKELRLDALTNTELNDSTLPFIIIRIRDTDVDVRLQVFKKLMKNHFSISQLTTLDLYQVIYDGLKNSSQKVVEQCELFLQQSFGKIIQDDSIIQEDSKQKSARKSMNVEQVNHINEAVKRFLNLFQIDKTLIFPQLYSTILDGLKAILKSAHQDELSTYFRDALRNLSNQTSGPEMSFIKVLCQMSQNQEQKTQLQQQMNLIVDHNFPEGTQFAEIFNQDLDLLQYYELLQLAQLLINQEEIGRTKLLDKMVQFISKYKKLECQRLHNQKFNEIYEDRSDQELESRWFAQHHFEMPIIKSYYELMIPSIKVIKLLVSSQDQMAEQVFKVIQDLQKQIIVENIQQLEQTLQVRKEERQNLEQEKEALIKKKKQNVQSLQLNEQLLEQNEKAMQQTLNELDKMKQHNKNIDIHCLYLLDALFNQFDIAKIEDRIFIRLKTIITTISEKYKSGDDCLAKKLSFRCLGYIPLFGIDVGGSTIATLARILDQSIPTQKNNDNPMTITALRSILDALLMYDDDQAWVIDSETYGKQKILSIIMKFAFKSEGVIQAIALEGLCKLLIHDKILKPQVWIAQFLFLWFDVKLRSQQLPLQIVTSFLKLYITSSLQFLRIFEKGLELYFSICCYLHYVKDQILNPDLFDTQQWQENSLIQAASAGIKMMSYKINGQKSNPSLAEFKDILESRSFESDFIGPQERFIMYLCKLVSDHNNIILQKVITQVTKQADFLEMYDIKEDDNNKLKPKQSFYQSLIISLEQCIERLEKANADVKNENNFLKVLQEEVGLQAQDEGQVLRDAIMKDFELQREDANNLVKELKKQGIIIQGQKQKEQVQAEENYQGESDSDDGVKKKRKQSSDSEIPTRKGGNKKRR